MAYSEIVSKLDPQLVSRLREAVATGRWPDGSAVTEAQKEHSLQAVIAWEADNLPPEERVGFIDKGAKGEAGSVEERVSDAPRPLRWADGGDGSDA